jgi:hypothetical protein
MWACSPFVSYRKGVLSALAIEFRIFIISQTPKFTVAELLEFAHNRKQGHCRLRSIGFLSWTKSSYCKRFWIRGCYHKHSQTGPTSSQRACGHTILCLSQWANVSYIYICIHVPDLYAIVSFLTDSYAPMKSWRPALVSIITLQSLQVWWSLLLLALYDHKLDSYTNISLFCALFVLTRAYSRRLSDRSPIPKLLRAKHA